MTQVKICGNTNPEDARLALDLGADYLGLIFAESKRKIDLNQAKRIMAAAPDFDRFVGVFLNQSKEEVQEILDATGIAIVQFHGDETARYCSSFMERGYSVIKTFHIKDEMSLKRIDEYDVFAFLMDTYTASKKGGSGQTFDWNLLADKPFLRDRLFLAGGLNVDNLKSAIETVHPFAVDVASGVESEPGKKDPKLLKMFIEIAKNESQKNA